LPLGSGAAILGFSTSHDCCNTAKEDLVGAVDPAPQKSLILWLKEQSSQYFYAF